MLGNSWLRSKDKGLRKAAIYCIFLAPFTIAALVLAFAAFPFHYLPHSVFWPAAFAVVLLSSQIVTQVSVAEANRKVHELETELLRVKAGPKSSN
jgi:hypothetical protein